MARSSSIAPIKIDLLSPVLEQRTIETVFDLLVKKLKISVMRSSTVGATPETVAARYADDIASGLNSAADPRPRWIVFDSLDRPVAPEIKRFICELVQLRLAREFENCNFFLLGANRGFGMSDPNHLADLENLASFAPKEIEDAVAAINSLGSNPKKLPRSFGNGWSHGFAKSCFLTRTRPAPWSAGSSSSCGSACAHD